MKPLTPLSAGILAYELQRLAREKFDCQRPVLAVLMPNEWTTTGEGNAIQIDCSDVDVSQHLDAIESVLTEKLRKALES